MTAEDESQPSTEERLSDQALARSTGYRWDEWFVILDAQGAAEKSRAEIAQFLNERYSLSLWWANTINVGYERARGAQAKQERLRRYEISTSKTVPVTVDRLFSAFVEPSGRERWLGNAALRLRTTQANRWARFDWQDGPSRVSAHFTDKGERSAVKVHHTKLLTAEEAESMKRYWRARLTELQRALEHEATTDR